MNDESLGESSQDASTISSPEKTFSQEEVNRIAHERTKAVLAKKDREMEELKSSYEKKLMNDTKEVPAVDIDKLIDERVSVKMAHQSRVEKENYEQEQLVSALKKIGSEFNQKITEAENEHPGLSKEIERMGMGRTPDSAAIVIAANSLDNTAEIIAEFKKSPHRYAQLLILQKESPEVAYDEMKKLSETIKNNKSQANQGVNHGSLGRTRSSATTTTSSGPETISSLRGRPEFRC